MQNNFKFLQIGLGSMGKRRIRNLLFHNIKKENIFGFDISPIRTAEIKRLFGIQIETNFTKAVKKFTPDIFIISTPPNLHMKYCLQAIKLHKHFFVEVSSTSTDYKQLIKLLKKTDIIAAPSCTYRFNTPIKKIKNIITSGKIGKVEAFLHHMGQYLPDWHPWENYKQFYASKSESSALREMFPHEISWISWVLNTKFTHITGLTEKCSDLDMSIPDVYGGLLKSENHIVGSMFLDLISRKPFRSLKILGSEGTIEWELTEKKIKLYRSKTKKSEIISLSATKSLPQYQIANENMYEEEIKTFLDSLVYKKPFPYTFTEDLHYFKLLTQLEKSNNSHI